MLWAHDRGYDLLRASACACWRYRAQALKWGRQHGCNLKLSMHSIFKLLQLTSLQTPKLSNFRNFKHWNSTSTFNAFNLQTLTTYKPSKLPNSQTLKKIQALELHVSQTFEILNVNLYPPIAWNFSNFQTLKLLSFHSPGFKLSISKLSNFRTRAWGLLCEPLRVLQRSFVLLPRATRVAALQTSKLDSHSNFQTPNSHPLSNSKLSSFRTSNSSFSKLFNCSNSPIWSNTYYAQALKNSSSKNPTRDTYRLCECDKDFIKFHRLLERATGSKKSYISQATIARRSVRKWIDTLLI